jgi:DNA polymerase III subunit delta'
VPIVPLYGHVTLTQRLLARILDGSFPSSLLLHGRPGIGKQRLALWLGQALLCSATKPPCGVCQNCRFAQELTHPDLHWTFPRPRLKNPDAAPDDIAADLLESIAERVTAGGLYARPSGSEGIFVSTVRLLVREAALAPGLAARKIFVIGDAERMVPQEGAEFAANAFLKLLEEPPVNTFLILTSSEPAALLPTIRSRLVAVRVPPLAEADVRAFLADAVVKASSATQGRNVDALVAAADGAPGNLFDAGAHAAAIATARRLLDAATEASPSGVYDAALSQSLSGARGGFSDTLDALTAVLAERTRDALSAGDAPRAQLLARAADVVEAAKERTSTNVNPQLLTWRLLRDMQKLLQ